MCNVLVQCLQVQRKGIRADHKKKKTVETECACDDDLRSGDLLVMRESTLMQLKG